MEIACLLLLRIASHSLAIDIFANVSQRSTVNHIRRHAHCPDKLGLDALASGQVTWPCSHTSLHPACPGYNAAHTCCIQWLAQCASSATAIPSGPAPCVRPCHCKRTSTCCPSNKRWYRDLIIKPHNGQALDPASLGHGQYPWCR